ncbi:MAG: hypothetical protein RQ750_15695 [Roseovarius sp.]|nr:hypothetical protein [Roseovarius sp.]
MFDQLVEKNETLAHMIRAQAARRNPARVKAGENGGVWDASAARQDTRSPRISDPAAQTALQILHYMRQRQSKILPLGGAKPGHFQKANCSDGPFYMTMGMVNTLTCLPSARHDPSSLCHFL